MSSMTRIALIPPQQGGLRAWWDRALAKTSLPVTTVSSHADCQLHLRDESTLAYVIFGNHAWRDLLGDDEQVRTSLRNKMVYRFGCSAKTEARALLRKGLSAFIGYDRELGMVLSSEAVESFFFRPIL